MQKTTTKKQHFYRTLSRRTKLAGVLSIALVFAASSTIIPRLAEAQSYDAQIRELQNQNSQVQAQVAELRSQAGSYQEAIANFENQINAVAVQIANNEAQQAEVQRQIDEAQAELERQKNVLGQNIRAMYLEGKITTVEMLATSKNLSDFVDKEAYRGAVQRKIQDTLTKIAQLQNQLNAKKQEIEALLKEQQEQRAMLDAARAEQASLLAMNQGQQAQFSQQLKENNKKIADLRAQQAIENARLFGGGTGTLGGGGYPWGSAPCIHTGQVNGSCYNYDWAVNGQIYNWNLGGYGYRNCTDWVAYRVKVAGGYVPSGLGNAKTWDDRAPGYGYTVSSTPRQGAAAVSNAGYYGHVMYVESYDPSSGDIVVSDYNRSGTGLYAMTSLTYVGTGSYRAPNGVVSQLNFVWF